MLPVFWRLNLLFVGLPILELFMIFLVMNFILFGSIFVLLEIIVTGFLGAFFVRRQGLSCLYDIQRLLDRGETPTDEFCHGVLILIAGALLITPGLITDFVGFLLLIYPLRCMVISYSRFRFDESRLRGRQRSEPTPNRVIDV